MIRVVVLDWGDTLMRDFRVDQGPMASWPRVEAVAGARTALCALRPRYRLAVATNADESDAGLVRAALARVEFDSFIDAVFSSRDLGVRKPEPAFFHAVLAGLGCQPEQAIMVGDSYENDIVAAARAGMRTIWLRSGEIGLSTRAATSDPARSGSKESGSFGGAERAGGRFAAADAVILSMADLPAAVAALNAMPAQDRDSMAP